MDEDVPEEGYEPDAPEQSFPQPRAAAIRRGVLARQSPSTKKPRTVAKGGSRIFSKERQRQALELRKGGASYTAIATAVGYADQSAARKAVMRAFAEVIQEPVLELKTIQIERLNHMLLTLWPKVQQGDERAIDTSLRVMDKIDRLMGTEVAQQVDVNVHQQNAILVIDGSKEDFIRSMAQMAGLQPDGSNRELPQGSQGHSAAPPSGVIDGEIVDADTYDGTGIESVPYVLVTEPEAVPAKKKLDFGVRPKGEV